MFRYVRHDKAKGKLAFVQTVNTVKGVDKSSFPNRRHNHVKKSQNQCGQQSFKGGFKGLPFSKIFRGLGQNVHRERRAEYLANIYYFFAKEFGWDKEKVDKQQAAYLGMIIELWNKEQRKANMSHRFSRKLK